MCGGAHVVTGTLRWGSQLYGRAALAAMYSVCRCERGVGVCGVCVGGGGCARGHPGTLRWGSQLYGRDAMAAMCSVRKWG